MRSLIASGAACVFDAQLGPLWIFGTVLPWYGDPRGGSAKEEIEAQNLEWNRLVGDNGDLGCAAGDFNVNLGGPHCYGSRESKAPVKNTLRQSNLIALTDFPRTRETQPDYGLIDHIAVSSKIADHNSRPRIWEKTNNENKSLSDHLGVSVDLTFN